MLEIAPHETTFPLLAATFLAPLGEALELETMLFISGTTGSRKTEIASIAQAHYGKRFNRRSTPVDWQSTDNAILCKAFAAKDALMLVDDFVPKGSSQKRQEYQDKIESVGRTQGNGNGRSTQRGTSGINTPNYPRGIILSTGEELPWGESLLARMFICELTKHDVNNNKLSELRNWADEGLLANSMSGYISWLTSRVNSLRANLQTRKKNCAKRLQNMGWTKSIFVFLTLSPAFMSDWNSFSNLRLMLEPSHRMEPLST